jgi:fibronectin type 3 domain-containing protein
MPMRGRKTTFVIITLVVLGGLIASHFSLNQLAKADYLWDIQQVDNSINDVGSYTAMVLDSNGFPHFSYIDETDGMLRYANWTGIGWSIESIISGAGPTSIALDSDNYPHIVYFEPSLGLLMYTWWNETFWDFQIIDNSQMIEGYISMKLDSTIEPHISGCDVFNENLMYWNRTGTTWNSHIVDPDACDLGYTSLYLDSNEYPHISYINSTSHHLKYAKWTQISWSIDIIDDMYGPGRYNSIILDSNDIPHISYYDDTNKDLRYAWKNPIFDWEVEVVDSFDDVGMYTSITLDQTNNPYISYYSNANKSLKLAEWTSTEWDIDVVDSAGSVGKYNSIALNNSDYPRIGYYDEASGDLKYARGLSPTAPSEPINLQAIGDDSKVLLTWNSSSSDGGSAIANYTIYRGTSPGGETFLAMIGDVLSYLDSSVSNGQTYYFKVTATNAVGESPQSNEASATPATIPSAPQDVQVYDGDSYVNITWNPPIFDGGSAITGYMVYKNDSVVPYASLPASRFWLNDTSVVNGVTYIYNISAINNVGEGPTSTISGISMAAPSEPIVLLLKESDSEINISWIAPISNGGSTITHYRIYRGTSPDDLVLLAELDNQTFTYTDTGLTNGETYYYRVCAVNAVGEGANTTEMIGTPVAAGKGFLEEFWWVLIIPLLVIFILVVLLFMRRKRSEEEIGPGHKVPPVPPSNVEEVPKGIMVTKIKDIKTKRPKGKMPSPETVTATESVEAKARSQAIPRKVVKKPVQKVYQKRKVLKKPSELIMNEEKGDERD